MAKRTKRHAKAARPNTTPTIKPLAAAVIAALYPTGAVIAQESQPGDEAVEMIVVTGSRIRRDTFSSATPIDVVVTESAAVRGIPDVATLLQTTTVAAGSPQVTPAITSEFVENGGFGANTISLRGLGANRTLVLLNGRRAGPAGVQGTVSAYDLNTIPLSAIDRVEILKDGASSIYGSDAVAGVVNIITKKEEGATVEAFVSAPEQSGGEQFRINGSWGKKFDRGFLRVTADYGKTEILQKGDRDFFECDEDYVFEQGSNFQSRADVIDARTGEFFCDGLTWGHVWVYDYASETDDMGNPLFGDGTTNAGPPVFLMQFDHDGRLAEAGIPPLDPPGNPNHLTAPPGWFPVSNGTRLTKGVEDSDHPLQDLTTLVPEAETTTLFVEGDFEVTDNITAYAEVLLNRRETNYEGYEQIWTYVYNYDSADWGGPSDPFSQGWTGANWLSPLAISDHNDHDVTVDYMRFVAGLTGEFQTFMEGWSWDLSFQYSNSDGEYTDEQVLEDSLQLPYFRTGSCVGQVSPISNRECVDIDWFDSDFLNGRFTPEERNFLFGVEIGRTKYIQRSVEGFVTGDVFEMPAGSVAVALGFHYREDEISDRPGEITLAGNAWGVGGDITVGEDKTKAFFGEVEIPLLADKPFVEQLDLTASARWTDVDSYGSDTTYKAGLNWSLTDQLRLRSTFGTSFRAPALFELYLADSVSFINARDSDPCINWGGKVLSGEISQRTADNCAADGLPSDHLFTVSPTVLTGGGAGVLDAETSEAFTVGFIWQPPFADLSFSVDYFDILVEDEVDVIGAQRIVAGCYDSLFFPDEPLCDLFTRASPTAPLPNAILTINDSFINVAKQQIKGMDVAARWVTDMPGNWGTLTIDTEHTFNFEDTVALFDETEEDLSGLAGHPEWVGNLDLTLDWNEWSFFWGMNFVGSTDNYAHFGSDTVLLGFSGSESDFSSAETVEIDLKAEQTTYHSLSATYQLDNGYLVRLGVANVFDEIPPRLSFQGTGNEVRVVGKVAFYSQYDWLARRYFLNVTKDF